MRVIRWKAVVPFGIAILLVALFWWLLLDWTVEWAIEYTGTEMVGARVDVGSVRTSLLNGSVRVRGLEVTDPDQPMTNLIQADEIVARVRGLPLLEKKIVVDTMAVRGVRFGTPRRSSGAIARRSATTGRVARAISDWAGRINIPPLNLQGLSSVVDLSRVNPDSLRTVGEARGIARQSDSLRGSWQTQLVGLDPGPQVDSTRALIARLKAADTRALGLGGTRELIATSRGSLARLGEATDRVKAFEAQVQAGTGSLREGLDGLAAARQADYARALGLVNLPSLSAPDLSPSLFGAMAVERIKPVLYWLNLAEQYLPPGLDPRRETGPDRARASGTTVRFPRARELPGFLLVYAGADAEVGGTGTAAGRYSATITGLTTAPALYGRPTRVAAQRSGAVRGPQAGSVYAVLNHVQTPLHDSVTAMLDGVTLPTVTLPAAGARLALGSGTVQLQLTRNGGNLAGAMTWRSSDVRWMRGGTDTSTAPSPVGSTQWAQDLLWRTVSRLNTVEIDVRVGGRVGQPALGVSSNVGREMAQALRRELGAQVAQQAQRVRARVDQLVGQQVQDAESRVSSVQTEVEGAVAAKRAELEGVRAELEAQIRDLTRRLPIRIL